MFTAEDINQARLKGRQGSPSAITIVGLVKNNHSRIRLKMEEQTFRVKAEHVLNSLISAMTYATEPNYQDVYTECRRRVGNIANALNLSSHSSVGKIHNGFFIDGQDELILLVAKPINPKMYWKDYQPARYLHHQYTNLNWDLGNGKPRGISIIEINLVELIWQYIVGNRYYDSYSIEVNRHVFLWRHVITRMIPTYMNYSTFNHFVANNQGTEIEKEEPLGWVRTPYIAGDVMKVAKAVNSFIGNTDTTPAGVLYYIPQFMTDIGGMTDATDLISLPTDFVTWQSWWPCFISNLYLAQFCFTFNKPAMDKFKSGLEREINVFERLRILDKLDAKHTDVLRTGLVNPLLERINS